MSEIQKEKLQAALQTLKANGAREVYLFGSAASGTMSDDSDIDLAVSGLPPRRFYETVGKLLGILECGVDLVDLDDDTPFCRYLKRKGRMTRVA